MQAIRQIIKPTERNYVLIIPDEYLNKKLEVLILEIENETVDTNIKENNIKKTSGVLKARNIDPLVWQKEIRSEWDNR